MPPPVDARSCRSSAAGTRDPHGWSAPPAGPSPRASSGHARRCASGRLQDGGCGPSRSLRAAQLPYAAANRPARSSGGPCNRCLATTPGRRRLSGKHQPPHPLVHNGGNRLVTSLNRSFNYHPLSIAEHVVKVKLFRDSALEPTCYSERQITRQVIGIPVNHWGHYDGPRLPPQPRPPHHHTQKTTHLMPPM